LVSARAVVIVGALGGALGAAGLGLAAPAWAQSKRYPPDPVDKDAEQAAKSDLWNAAITPERQPYQSLVRGAAEQLAQRTPAATAEAFRKLDQAVQLLPREPEAYRLRGEASLERRDWVQCAADLGAADAYTQRDDVPPKVMAELRRKLGLCQARAGKLGDAEKTLAEAVASGNAAGEMWMRLGEVRIAMGKLDEAIAALRSALDGSESSVQPLIRFMLAAAYDRARRPADALLEATEGLKGDPQLGVLQNPSIPPIHPGENEYMLGLAYSADKPRPEYALAYFRKFVKAAPQSPWRKRAEDHIRDVKAAALPDSITRTGTATIDLEAARVVVRRAMPPMRACLARHPTVVVEVEISRAGPRTPATDRLRPRFFSPPDGVTVRRAVGELAEIELDAIDRCLQPLASRIAMPPAKERDTYYKATFNVIAP
jgi:tetratricopeptide (TPR) repeat protein